MTSKVVQLMAVSPYSWEDAVQQAVTNASKTLPNIRSVHIQDQSAKVKNNKIIEYRVIVQLMYEVNKASIPKHPLYITYPLL